VPADSLWELASIALTMIGLSGVVAILGRRMHGEWAAGDIKRLKLMFVSGFRLLFAALLPLVFINFDLPDKSVWVASSGIAFAASAGLLIYLWGPWIPATPEDERSSQIVDCWVRFLFLATIVIYFFNATGIVFDQSFGPYFLACILSLTSGATFLVRLINAELILQNVTDRSDEN
jgi:hypothetical protein